MDQASVLGKELKALSDEDLVSIAGSGNADYVHITDEQCEKINRLYGDRNYCAVPNYGTMLPRAVFKKAVEMGDTTSLQPEDKSQNCDLS